MLVPVRQTEHVSNGRRGGGSPRNGDAYTRHPPRHLAAALGAEKEEGSPRQPSSSLHMRGPSGGRGDGAEGLLPPRVRPRLQGQTVGVPLSLSVGAAA